MKMLFAVAFLLGSVSFAQTAEISDGVLRLQPGQSVWEFQRDLVEPAYIYAEQSRGTVNWLYAGFVPRMDDSSRVKVVISKKGYTARVIQNFTAAEIAEYPSKLVSRYKEVNRVLKDKGATILQLRGENARATSFEIYAATINAIQGEMSVVASDPNSKYVYGLNLLKRLYPQNVFEVAGGVQTHFVYPITIHKSKTWPPAKNYRPYIVEERRSRYKGGNDIFGGFPAFWLDPGGAGTGMHGPIRYSDFNEPRADGKKGTMEDQWDENNFLNENYDPVQGLHPKYRWDLVRIANSHGCFRAETMEIRALLPSKPSSILKSVVFSVIDDYDRVTVPGQIENKIVNVDYYLMDPYGHPEKDRWLRSMYLGGKAKGDWKSTLGEFMKGVHTFPYLDPSTIEIKSSNGQGSATLMGLLNQAPAFVESSIQL